MVLPPIYSRRKRLMQAGGADVYNYDAVPNRVRVQVVQILRGALWVTNDCYETIVRQMRRELGVHRLSAGIGFDDELSTWLQEERDIDHWLDGVEMSLRLVDRFVRDQWNIDPGPDEVIAEFNARLQEAAVGYQYVSGEIVRTDSTLIHREVVVPALGLLSDPKFSSAEQEYRSAHEAYRHGELENCLVDCGKALESVLKIIGRQRGWPINENEPASRLIQAAVDAGFLAAYSQTALNHLKGLIESSTPTIRNKMGGHGAGAVARVVPQHLAAFQLHQTAAVILYLAEQDAALP